MLGFGRSMGKVVSLDVMVLGESGADSKGLEKMLLKT